MTTQERVAKSIIAKRRKAEARARAAAEQHAALEGHLAGTSWTPAPRRLALSDADRQRAHRARGREIGELPPPRHPRVREACRYNLPLFGKYYGCSSYEGMKPLLKRPPSPRMMRFVLALQDKILHGGLKHIRWPRGKGKTTWVKLAVMWAQLYGHLYFVVVVEKTKGMAEIQVQEIWKRIYTSPEISSDFPEFAIPMSDVALSPQRMRVQTYQGRPTYMKMDVSRFYYYKLPTMAGFPHTGGIIAYRGAEQALRGINIESARPDFFFLDDPQTDEEAKNPSSVVKIEEEIMGAVLGAGEIGERISAVMASTPIQPDDVSERFADPSLHPEWDADTEPFVTHWGPDCAEKKTFMQLVAVDPKRAHEFYIEHRETIEQGAEMMDDGDFNPDVEVSAYEHALYQLVLMKGKFETEMQLTPSSALGIYRISPKIVREAINNVPRGVVPACCTTGVLGFIDVHASAGLRWELAAFGPQRRVAVIAYGQFPGENKRLCPQGIPTSEIGTYLRPALRELLMAIESMSIRTEDGRIVHCSGICIDGGWQQAVVGGVVDGVNQHLKAKYPRGFCGWSKGFSCDAYSRSHHEIAASHREVADFRTGDKFHLIAAEECHTWMTANGMMLAYNSHYWKEVSQTSFFSPPLSPGSSSLYGADVLNHMQYSQELCADELQGKEVSLKIGTRYKWKEGEDNHYGDTHAGVLAYGALRGFFDLNSTDDDTPTSAPKRKRVQYAYVGR